MTLKEELKNMDNKTFKQNFKDYLDEVKERCRVCECSNCRTCNQDCKQCPCDSCELSILKDFEVLDSIVKKHFG